MVRSSLTRRCPRGVAKNVLMDPEQRRFTPATAPAAVPMELEQPPMSQLPPELQGHIASFVCGTELAWNVRALSRAWEELTERLLRYDFGPFAVDRRLVPGDGSLADGAVLTWIQRRAFSRLLRKRGPCDFFAGPAARTARDLDAALDLRRGGDRQRPVAVTIFERFGVGKRRGIVTVVLGR